MPPDDTPSQPPAPPPGDQAAPETSPGESGRRLLGLVVSAWNALKPALRIALPLVILLIVWRELRTIDLRDTREAMRDATPLPLVFAFVAALCCNASIGLYDALCFPSTPALGRAKRWGLGTMLGAWTNFLAVGPIGGPALRLFFYRRAGLDTPAILRGLGNLYIGMSAGFVAWVAAAFLPGLPAIGRVVFAAALAPLVALAIVAFSARVRGHAPFQKNRAMLLGVAGLCDWGALLAAFILVDRALAPPLPLDDLARTLLTGQSVGYLSMTPGGLGSADAVWISMMTEEGDDASPAAAHVVLFRLVFYALPWLLSLVALYAVFARRWSASLRWQRRIVAGGVALNAVFLLASAATPAVRERLDIVADWLPLAAIEVSHAAAVVTAAIMLFLIRGLLRGYRGALMITAACLGASIVAHLIKGGDYEEAAVSAVLLVLLLGARQAFTRRGAAPVGWELTLAIALASLTYFVIIGTLAFEGLPRTIDTLTHFGIEVDASRFTRGSVLLALVAAAFIVRQAVSPTPERVYASDDEIERAASDIRLRSDRGAMLQIGAGDKAVWRNDRDDALAIYQRQRDKIIVLGEPFAPPGAEKDALRDLHAFAAASDLELVFYQLRPSWMEHLHDFGYEFFKLGEEAVVDVENFTLAGGKKAGFRQILRYAERAGVTGRVIEPPIPPDVLDQAQGVSDAWLRERGVHEMQFSLGYFSRAYLRRFPMVVAEQGGEVVAFANLLPARPGTEVAIDLVRYRSGVVDNLMDFTLIRAFEWAGARGYTSFNLGMSPLYDVGEWRRANMSERVARFAFLHGERWYNYKGLHAFKSKFHPRWEPRYLAYQNPWDWPGAVFSCARLIRARSRSDRRMIERARRAE